MNHPSGFSLTSPQIGQTALAVFISAPRGAHVDKCWIPQPGPVYPAREPGLSSAPIHLEGVPLRLSVAGQPLASGTVSKASHNQKCSTLRVVRARRTAMDPVSCPAKYSVSTWNSFPPAVSGRALNTLRSRTCKAYAHILDERVLRIRPELTPERHPCCTRRAQSSCVFANACVGVSAQI